MNFDEGEVLSKLHELQNDIDQAKEKNASKKEIERLTNKMLWNGMLWTQAFSIDY